MIGVIIALIFTLGSIGIMGAAIVLNQINPNYNSALAVPVYNALGIILALLGLGLSVIANKKNKDIKLAKHTLVLAIVCVILLAILFPFSNSGSLSIVR